MISILNTVLTLCLLTASILVNTGYYRCYSQDTVHIYGSCCSQKVVEHSCCAPKDSSGEKLEKQCCDKISVKALDQQHLPSGSQLIEPDKNKAFISFDGSWMSHTPWQKMFLHKSPSKSPPFKEGRHTYKLNCTFLC